MLSASNRAPQSPRRFLLGPGSFPRRAVGEQPGMLREERRFHRGRSGAARRPRPPLLPTALGDTPGEEEDEKRREEKRKEEGAG